MSLLTAKLDLTSGLAQTKLFVALETVVPMATGKSEVEFKTDVSHPRRSVAFLTVDESNFVNIIDGWATLTDNERRQFQTSFDYWVQGIVNNRRYHGWDAGDDKGKYKECFVFKNPPHRLYGFLCHPKSPQDTRYQTCVLVTHAKKKTNLTDPAEMDRAEKKRQDAKANDAVRQELIKKINELENRNDNQHLTLDKSKH